MIRQTPRLVLALLIAALIATRGLRTKSLSQSGAVAGFVVGFLSFASSIRFGITLLVFYLTSTRATRYKAHYKSRIEHDYTVAAGNRSAAQVLASSLPAVLLAVIYFFLYEFDLPINKSAPVPSCLLIAYMLFFAACAGDTFSSEIGIAMPGPSKEPVLITAPWRNVPRGTNGGITWEGTCASAVGGLIIGLAFFITGPELSVTQSKLIWLATFAGVIGSAIDSLIGAVMQSSWLDTRTGKIVPHVTNFQHDRSHRFEHISGRNLLTGEMVNALAATIVASSAPLLVGLFHT